MNVQDRLSAFDGWLTSRIEEAHAGRKDLAFRDLALEAPIGEAAWEYSLLEPGAGSPQGDGWSVYRLHGVWPEPPEARSAASAARGRGGRRLLKTIAGALFGKDDPSSR